jgi:hypothetical protein
VHQIAEVVGATRLVLRLSEQAGLAVTNQFEYACDYIRERCGTWLSADGGLVSSMRLHYIGLRQTAEITVSNMQMLFSLKIYK